jgi:hypothetical protein
MIVLDHQQFGMAAQDVTQLLGSLVVEGRSARVLGPGRQDGRRRTVADGAFELRRRHAAIVDGDGHRHQAQRRDEVEHPGKAGVLDRHVVAGTEVSEQRAFDAVEGAAHDQDPLGGDAVGPEPTEGEVLDLGEVGLGVAVADRRRVDPAEDGAQAGEQGRIGAAVGQVAHALGDGRRGPRGQGGPGAHAGALAAPAGHDAPGREGAVGGGDGRRGHAQLTGQFAHRRQQAARRQGAVAHGTLDGGNNLLASAHPSPVSYWYGHRFVP